MSATRPIPGIPTPRGWRVWAGLSLLVGLYALGYYAWLPALPEPSAFNPIAFVHHPPVAFYAHVFGASLALLLGPWQFLPGLRQRHPQWHRWIGRIYLVVGVGVGGVAGLLLAPQANGGLVAQTGFGTLAVVWLVSGGLAWWHILRGRVAEHRAWMLRNIALSSAAVTLRLMLPLPIALNVVLGWPLLPAYAAIAWLCWLPNLAWAEWWLRRRPHTAG